MTAVEVRSQTREIFTRLESNMIALVYAKQKNDEERQRTCAKTEKEIVNSIFVTTPEVYNSFMQLLIAEYKERTYWSYCDIHVEKVEMDILMEYERLIKGNRIWETMATSHKHDPTDKMYEGVYYQFYEALEYMGYNILNMTEDEVYAALESKYEN